MRWLAVWLAAVAWPVQAADGFNLVLPIRYAPEARTVGAVRTNCDLEGYAGRVFSERIKASHPGSVTLADPSSLQAIDGKVLRVSITHAHGPGGGGWSGTKSVTIRADLLEKGKLMGMRSFTRSTRSLMGAVSGTCPMLESCLDTLSKDVAVWLSGPVTVPSTLVPDPAEPEEPGQSVPAAGQAPTPN